jgi:hypothetical protein
MAREPWTRALRHAVWRHLILKPYAVRVRKAAAWTILTQTPTHVSCIRRDGGRARIPIADVARVLFEA